MDTQKHTKLNSSEIQQLVEKAREVRTNAYVPRDEIYIGVVLLADDGSVHIGCGVENTSCSAYNTCAEGNALAAAIASGHREFQAMVMVGLDDKFLDPCKICLQQLCDFAYDLPIYLAKTQGDDLRQYKLSELLL